MTKLNPAYLPHERYGERPIEIVKIVKTDEGERLGASFSPMGKTGSRARKQVIMYVPPGTPFAKAGVKVGDVLETINGTPVPLPDLEGVKLAQTTKIVELEEESKVGTARLLRAGGMEFEIGVRRGVFLDVPNMRTQEYYAAKYKKDGLAAHGIPQESGCCAVM